MADDGSIKARIVRSGIWVSIGETVVALLSFVKSVVLARLLSPDMFGLMGLCMFVIRAFETFTRPGVGQALIQRKGPFEEARDTAFTLLLLRGVILAILLSAAAPVVAAFYESETLEEMLRVLSLIFVIGGFLNVNTINRQKELNFRRITYLSQATAFFSVIVTAAVAYWLRNVWALVIGHIFTTLFQSAMSYYFIQGRPRLAFDRQVAGELLSYGKFITASSAVIFVTSSLDTAVIGKILGTEQLGYYVLAFTIANLVTANLSKLASGIMMPAYSKLQFDMQALRRAYLRTLSLVLLACLPATVGVLITAEFIIHIVYGEKWTNAVIPLQILVVFGMFRALASINGYLFEGVGKPQIPLLVSVMRLVFLVPMIIPLTRHHGLAGAAMAVAAAMAIQWVVFLILSARHLSLSTTQILSTLAGPIWKSLIMGGLVYWLSLHVDGMSKAGLAILISCGVVAYVLLNIRVMRDVLRIRS